MSSKLRFVFQGNIRTFSELIFKLNYCIHDKSEPAWDWFCL